MLKVSQKLPKRPNVSQKLPNVSTFKQKNDQTCYKNSSYFIYACAYCQKCTKNRKIKALPEWKPCLKLNRTLCMFYAFNLWDEMKSYFFKISSINSCNEAFTSKNLLVVSKRRFKSLYLGDDKKNIGDDLSDSWVMINTNAQTLCLLRLSLK